MNYVRVADQLPEKNQMIDLKYIEGTLLNGYLTSGEYVDVKYVGSNTPGANNCHIIFVESHGKILALQAWSYTGTPSYTARELLWRSHSNDRLICV